ncbi:D-alanyl-D-alanine carboxypeptidase/D-alanyl-D-alanine endopeptidase [Fibrella forsythiae]|uniref:D-alanyl-D-alanine carboxypeptidase/D-alanyl-D-alanine endopeptidase n=1 Tax=Fibrella forsythiae TaxID=2817061 RepID=UPI00286E41AC|nr:D-alanyl-D-alanine carboxypeptidase/D-alanyl-D-alanine-endopeptidase [Fibrella forsythiae]
MLSFPASASASRLILPVVVVFIWALTTSSASAQVQVSPDSSALQRLRTWATSLQTGPLASNGIVALSVRRVNDGRVIFGQNDFTSLSTASTLKLVSTATALATLGSTYSYTTTLEYDGVIKDSILQGNLYLRGTGDPSLGSGRFAGYPAWAALLKDISGRVRQAGIRRIDGAVIGDASFYNDQPIPDSWPFSDLGNYYGAGLFGLNFNENLYRVYFKSGPTLAAPAPVLRTDPYMPLLTFNNRVTTGPSNSGDEVNIYGAPFQNVATLDGTIPANSPEFAVKGAMPDPAYFTAYAITEQLRRDSVRVAGPATSYRPGTIPSGVIVSGVGNDALGSKPLPRTEVARYVSPPLSDLVRETNFQSINLYAEALMRSAARQIRQVPANWPESISAVTGFWKSKGVDLSGFRPRDGSGLSTTGALTTNNLTAILTAMTREGAYPAFYASIPVVGQTGTVRGLAKNTKAAGNVRAKSGTIEGVRAYAGYFTASDGTLMAFSLMINKYAEGKYAALTPQIERLFVLLVSL